MNGRVLGAVAILGLAAGAAFYLYQQPSPTAAPAPPPAGPPSPIAKLVATVPSFTLADRTGTMRSLADWQGKALIVNFWATWCAPCRKEIPLLQKLQRDHGDEGFQVVGIAVDFRDKVLAYADEMKIDYPLLIGEQEGLDAAKAFGMGLVFPFTAFADQQRRIVALKVGELHADEADFILDQVARLNAGEGEIEAVRRAITLQLRILAERRGRKGAVAPGGGAATPLPGASAATG